MHQHHLLWIVLDPSKYRLVVEYQPLIGRSLAVDKVIDMRQYLDLITFGTEELEHRLFKPLLGLEHRL